MKNRVLVFFWLCAIFSIPTYAGAPQCDLALREPRVFTEKDSETLEYLKTRYGVDKTQIQFTENDHYPIIVRGVDEAALAPSTVNLPQVVDSKVHDVVVIGGGPGGLSSALYLTDGGKEVLVLDPNERLGGLAQGSTLDGIRVGTGAAYSVGPGDIDEYKIFQHIGLGNYKKPLAIHEPIDSLFTKDGQVALGIWEPENMGSKGHMGKLPTSFAVFKRMLRHLVQDQSIYDITTDTGKMLDNTWAADWIKAMPEELSKLKDSQSKQIYERFLSDPRVDKANPMADVIDLMNRYCRSALGKTSDGVSAYALVEFYEKEMGTRFTGTYGTGEIVEKLLAKLQEPSRAMTAETHAAVTKIIDTADGAEIHYVKDGKEFITKAKAVVFSAPLKLATKIIDRFSEIAPEAYEAANGIEMTDYAVQVIRTKGHPLRETYDLWLAGMNDAASEPTDVISSRWQDPAINGFDGMRHFQKNPADDKGAITIYQPLGAVANNSGFGKDEAIADAERALNIVKSKLNPYLRTKFGVAIEPELIESNRWPLSIHVATKGWMQKAQVFRKPVGHIYFANNNMGLPEFEKTLAFGKAAADKILSILSHLTASARVPVTERAPASAPLDPKTMPKLDKRFVVSNEACEVKSPKRFVYFFKQWHLAPGVDTRTELSQSLEAPQHVNQTAIYRQIDLWLNQHHKLDLIAEGCPFPREVNTASPEKFNGWDVSDLSAKILQPEYADLVTNIGYKIEAKWKSKIMVRCGDDAEAIKKNLLAFSDARGVLGYISRLEQFKSDPDRAKVFLDGVIETYHLPADTTIPQAIAQLNLQLKRAVDEIEHWIDVRNQKLVETITNDDSSVVAVVFGGAHAPGVEKLLEEKGIGCQILEPKGYSDDETQMLETLKKFVSQRLRTTK